ncbi:unnamed protein product [Adineta ricciae]|uniref:Uncharacterized protein n=1 Tax=Adineta ricciae TaxID=249248 RepID=A0A815ZWT8_ADIRI|nr:unnamed protein product [Adineta ricciae]CAF1588893.1 unnamed protein product [Adineta ricciae]
MDEILAITDRERVIFEKFDTENIEEDLILTTDIRSTYLSIAIYHIKKDNSDEILDNINKAEEVISRYKGKDKLKFEYDSFIRIAFIYELINTYDQAIFYYEKLLSYISQNDYNEFGKTYYFIARVYQDKKDYLISLSKCKIALTFLLNSTCPNHEQIGKCYDLSSSCFTELFNYKFAFIYAEKANEHFSSCDPIQYDSMLFSYTNCTIILLKSKPYNYKQSLEYILTSRNFIQHCSNENSLQTFHFLVASIYFSNKEYENAIVYYQKSLEYCKEVSDILRRYDQIWTTYLTIGEIDKACDIMKQSIDYQMNLESIDYLTLSTSYINMGSNYEQLGNYKLALLTYQSAYEILDKYQNDKTHENYCYIYIYITRIHLRCGQLFDALRYSLKSESIDVLNKKNELSPISIFINSGLIQCKLGNYYKSLDYFGEAWEILFAKDVNSPTLTGKLYNSIGYAYYKLGQTDIAMENYLKCLSMFENYLQHPNLGEIYKNIGLIYEEKEKNYSLALSYYKKALNTVPNNKHVNYIFYKSLILTLEKRITWMDYISYYFSKTFCSLS